MWRNLFTGFQRNTRPWDVLDPNEDHTTTEQDKEGSSSKTGPPEHPEEK